MVEDMIDAITHNDMNKLDNLKALEGTNNKLSYFSLRILNREGYKKDEDKTNSIYYTILCVEEIVDDLRDLCSYIIKDKPKINKTTIALLKDCLQYFKTLNSLFNKCDDNVLFEFDKGVKSLDKEVLNKMKKREGDTIILSFLHKITSKISHISKEIYY